MRVPLPEPGSEEWPLRPPENQPSLCAAWCTAWVRGGSRLWGRSLCGSTNPGSPPGGPGAHASRQKPRSRGAACPGCPVRRPRHGGGVRPEKALRTLPTQTSLQPEGPGGPASPEQPRPQPTCVAALPGLGTRGRPRPREGGAGRGARLSACPSACPSGCPGPCPPPAENDLGAGGRAALCTRQAGAAKPAPQELSRELRPTQVPPQWGCSCGRRGPAPGSHLSSGPPGARHHPARRTRPRCRGWGP